MEKEKTSWNRTLGEKLQEEYFNSQKETQAYKIKTKLQQQYLELLEVKQQREDQLQNEIDVLQKKR